MMIIPGIVSLVYLRSAPHKPIDSMAVLPFEITPSDPETERFAREMSENLIARLSQLPNLTLASRDAVMSYKGNREDARSIGHELGVRAVVQGSIRKKDETLVVSAKLVDAGTNELIWGQQYQVHSQDMASLQAQIVQDIADHIRFH